MKCRLSLQERLKDLRVERGLKLEELSALTGISKSALGNYENEDYREINHGNLVILAQFYQVSMDYLLCLTENRNHPNVELQELHLSDEMIAVLKNDCINNRLLCEIVTHEKFPDLMMDAEIYVDGLATKRFRDLNASLEDSRQMILENYPNAKKDRFIKTLEAGQIVEEDFFCHLTHKTWDNILLDIRKAHEQDFDSVSDNVPSDELAKEFYRVMRSPVSNSSNNPLDLFIQAFCQLLQLKPKKLTESERNTIRNLLKKSPAFKRSGLKFRRKKK